MKAKQTLIVPWIGESLNKVYASAHWSFRKRNGDFGKKQTFYAVKEQKLKKVDNYPVKLIATPMITSDDRAYDVTNYALALKVIEDGLVMANILAGDSTEYVCECQIKTPVLGSEHGMRIEILETNHE